MAVEKLKLTQTKLKLFSMLLLLGLGVIWVAASVAGAEELSSAFYALAAAGITVLCLIVVYAFGRTELELEIEKVPILKAVKDEVNHGEILKGLMLITCEFSMVLYLVLTALNQFVRKYINAGCLKRIGLLKTSVTGEVAI